MADRQEVPINMLCSQCCSSNSQSMCECTGTKLFHCQECQVKHEETVAHRNYAHRQVSYRLGKAEALQNLVNIDRCSREYSSYMDRLLSAIRTEKETVEQYLTSLHNFLTTEIGAALMEVETTMSQNSAKLTSEFAIRLRDFHPGELVFFRYSFDQQALEHIPVNVLKIEASLPPLPLHCSFVQHCEGNESITVSPSASFTKGWRLKNTGRTWPSGCRFECIRGWLKGFSVPLPCLQSNEPYDVRVTATAPDTEGVYESLWQACDCRDSFFGVQLSLEVRAAKQFSDLPLEDQIQYFMSTQPEIFATVLTTCNCNFQLAIRKMTEISHE